MKSKSVFRLIRSGSPAAAVFAMALASLITSATSSAGTIFWDPNGSTALFGSGGIWGTDAYWTTDVSGLFSAGVTATSTMLDVVSLNPTAGNALTMSVTGRVNALTLNNASSGTSPIIINDGVGGVIHLYGAGSTAPAIAVGGNDRVTTINVPIVLEQGPGSDVYFNGAGNNTALTLTGGITSTNNVNLVLNNAGTTTISTGVLNIKGSITNIAVAGNLNKSTTISASIGSNVTNVFQNGGYSSILQLAGTNSYSGLSIVNSGLLQFTSLNAIGGSGKSVIANFGGGVGFSGMTDTDIATALSTRISLSSRGAIAVNGSTANNFDFNAAGLTFASLGATYGGSGNAAVTYTGLYTPYGTDYRLGGSMGHLILGTANQLTGASNNVTVTGIGSTIAAGNTTVSLTDANNYTGATNVYGGVFQLQGALGAITGTSGINLGGGNFQLTNTSTAEGSVNRVNDALITGNGGTLTYANTSGNVYAETVGALVLSSGTTNIVLSTNMAAGSQALTFGTTGTGNLTQSVSGNAATVAFAVNTANANNNIKVFGAGTTAAGEIIAPWATYGLTAAAQTDYAIATADVIGPRNTATSAESTWTGGISGNYTTTTAANNLSGSRSMNTLRYNVANGALALGANNLDTNGILNVVAGTLTISGTGGLRQQGTAAGTMYLTSGLSNAHITITAPVKDNTGSLSLVKAGPGTLLLGNNTNATPVASTYSGRTSVLGGTFNFNNLVLDAGGGATPAASPLGLSTNFDLYPGTTFAYTGVQAATVVSATSRNINLAGTGSGTITMNGFNTNDSNFNWGSISGIGTGQRSLLIKIQGDRPVFSYGSLSDMSDGGPVSLSVTWGSGSSTSNGTMQLRGDSTFSGPMLLTGGGNGNTPGILLIGGGTLGAGGAAYTNNVFNTPAAGGVATLTSAGQPVGTYANTITFAPATFNQAALYYAGTTAQTLSGVISGPGGISVGGSGSLTLTNNNTYTGPTTSIGAGNLILSQNLTIQNSPLACSTGIVTLGTGVTTPVFGGLSGSTNVASVITTGYNLVTNLTLNSAASANITYAGTIAEGMLGMTLTKTGTGIQVLSGNNTSGFTGGANVNYGTLTYLNTNAMSVGGTTVAAGATLGLGVSGASAFTAANVSSLFAGTLANVTNDPASNVGIDTTNGAFTYTSSVPSSTRGLVKLGANALTLTGNNNIGLVTLSAGTLIATGNNTFTGGLTVSAGTTATLSGNNTITGEITNLGTLNINSAGALGSASLHLGAAVTIANTTNAPIVNSNSNPITVAGNITFAGNSSALNLGTGGVTLLATPNISISVSGPLTIGGVITGAFGLTKQNAGVLELTGVNTYTGTTGYNNSGGAGWIRVSGTGTLGTGAVTLTTMAFLDITSSAIQNVGKVTNNGGWIQGGTINSTDTSTTAFAGQGYITSNLQSTSGGLTANNALGLFLSGTNTYGGVTTVTNYLVPIKPVSLPGSGATGTISIGGSGLLALRTGTGQWDGTAIDGLMLNAGLTLTSGGVVGIDTAAGDFSYSGVLPAKANLAITKMGANNLTLTGANLYTGKTTINRGMLTVGDGATGSLNGISGTPLTFSGTGTFNVAEAVGSTQGMGVLTFSAGDGTVKSTNSGGNSFLTFSNVVARSAGATGNFAYSGGDASTNKISLTQVAGVATPTGTLLDKGLFFGGNSYASYDAVTASVRAYTTGDVNYVANAGGANAIVTGATTNVVLSGAVTAQNTASINTLSITGAYGVDMAAGQALTVNGILKTGGNSATISNTAGTGSIGAAGAGEMVIRTDLSSDVLSIGASILGGTVTKTGAGTLELSGTNTFTALRLNQGQLNINSNTAIPAGATLTINEGTTLDNTSVTLPTVTLAGSNLNVNINGSFTYVGTGGNNLNLNGDNSGSFNFLNDATVTVAAGTLSMKNVGAASNAAVTKSGLGTLIWGGNGTMNLRGPLTVNAGVVSCMTANTQDYQSIGTGQVFLGDTTPSNSNPATINFVNSATDLNPITVRAGSSGTIAITNDANNHNFTGPITLNNNLTLSHISTAGVMSFYGGISGTGKINIGNNTDSITLTGISKPLANVGTVSLRAPNTYTGATSIQSGSLSINSIKDVGGVANSLGQPLLADATITIGNGSFGGTLVYTGTGDSTDRVIDMAGTTGGVTLDQSSPTGLLKFTSPLAVTGVGAKTLTLQGSTAGTGEIGGAISDSGGGATALTKTGTGIWTLSGNNTYNGITTVSGGKLFINGTDSGTGAVNVTSAGATLGGSGLISGAVTVSSGGILAPGTSVGTLNLGGGLTLAPGSVFDWENNTINALGSAGTNWDVANVAGTTAIDSTASTGSKIKLQFTNAATNFSTSFWNVNRTWDFITGGVTAAFDASNISVYVDSILQGVGNAITGQGTFSTAVAGSDLQLVWTADVVTDAYQNWIDTFTSIPVIDRDPQDDPDGDGASNLEEFAFAGIPDDSSKRPLVFGLEADSNDAGSANEMILTAAVRTGAAFSTAGSPAVSNATVDGLDYAIQGSTDLSSWSVVVTPVPMIDPGLPPLPANYQYVSFSLNGSDGLAGKGFLRAQVVKP